MSQNFDVSQVAPLDVEPWFRWEGHSDYFCLVRLHVIKITNCGFVLSYYGARKFVLKDAIKKFAHPTEQEAEEAFIKRRTKHVAILEARLEVAKRDLEVFAMPGHRYNRNAFDLLWSV